MSRKKSKRDPRLFRDAPVQYKTLTAFRNLTQYISIYSVYKMAAAAVDRVDHEVQPELQRTSLVGPVVLVGVSCLKNTLAL